MFSRRGLRIERSEFGGDYYSTPPLISRDRAFLKETTCNGGGKRDCQKQRLASLRSFESKSLLFSLLNLVDKQEEKKNQCGKKGRRSGGKGGLLKECVKWGVEQGADLSVSDTWSAKFATSLFQPKGRRGGREGERGCAEREPLDKGRGGGDSNTLWQSKKKEVRDRMWFIPRAASPFLNMIFSSEKTAL